MPVDSSMMFDNKCTIILPTHSDYLDVCENFISLMNKNWPECKYKVVLSVFGKNRRLSNCEYLYNETADTLLQCISNAANIYPSDSYMIFLGDAFITDRVDDSLVDKVVKYFIKNRFEYCCLRPKKAIAKEKILNSMFRNINVKDRYSHSFISFLTSKEFLEREFGSENIETDRDFEIKYLNMANEVDLNYYFEKHVILLKDIFSIRPGIEKGQWNRSVYRMLKRRFPDVKLANREEISIKWQLLLIVRSIITPYISNNIRRLGKRLLSKDKKTKFDTET